MNIAIFSGGDSSEFEISVRSAIQVKKWLELAGHSCFRVEVKKGEWNVLHDGEKVPLDKNNFSVRLNRKKISFEFVWNTIHGTPGEDGKLQGCFDMAGIPYNCSNHLSSALTFNKYTCKSFLIHHRILTPEACLVKRNLKPNLEAISEQVRFPCFVKPNSGGSSFGVAKVVRFEELETALKEALREDSEAIVERYIKGTEVTCGLVKTGNEFTVFPVTEIVTKNEFFDYEAKYVEGKADEITPARIPAGLASQCAELAKKIYDLTDCSGIIRSDFIIKGNQIYFLELNSIPGMTSKSIIPKQVEKAGMKMENVLQLVIDHAMTN